VAARPGHPVFPPRRGAGMALVTVLWLIALLTLLATTVVTLSVTHRRTAERYAEAVQGDLTIDAAMRVMALRLIAPSDQVPASPLGQAQGVSVLDENVSVTVEREAGRIDLNAADPDLLLAFFAANGWRESDARSMADRIVDWRDPEVTHSPHHEPFESVDELRQVPGSERIGSDLFDDFTVFTHSSGCVESVATPAVKRALKWADQRQLGGHRWSTDAPNAGRAGIGVSTAAGLGGEVLRIRGCVNGRVDRCRVAVVRLTGSTLKPLQVFEWQTVMLAAGVSADDRGT
jgi:general secretion pathway protein K